MAQFFIDRPIFAWVISIIIMLGGALTIPNLPVAQYPDIAPPEITISVFYPGASATTIENAVIQVIEQNLKGIDNVTYMYSNSQSSGQGSITVAFEAGTDSDIAQVQVQNKLQLATPRLPESVQRQGIQVTKSTSNFLMVVGFYSEDNSMTSTDISDFVASSIQDPVSRVTGVGDLQIFGGQYAMRIWCKPDRFEQFGITVSDVANGIRAQNDQVPSGQIGARPAVEGQSINVAVTSLSYLQTVEDFENILVRVNEDGSAVYIRDVADVAFGSESYMATALMNGMQASGLGVKLASGANALSTVDAVKEEMERLSQFLPAGVKVDYPYDTSPFVRLSIQEVFKTLLEAIALVFLVMYLFLQNFRATLIPTIAVPVVLLGTFAVLGIFGFSINTLTMFGMVLAIGLLVDDAIVVVENVERVMQEEGLGPREAAKKSMHQITGALVGIALVLSAVFIPMAFFGGSVGVIYRQFSITIVSAMVLSVIVALVLTPALCATMLKPHKAGHVNQNGFFGWFNRVFDRFVRRYKVGVARILKKPLKHIIVYVLIVGAMAFEFMRMPTSFLPEEDQGILLIQVQLPAGATEQRTSAILARVQKYFAEKESKAVENVMTIAGFGFSGTGQNNAMAFVRLHDWSLREGDKDLTVWAVAGRAMREFSQITDAQVFAFAPPAILELGTATGFDFELLDQAGNGHEALMQARNQLLMAANSHPDLIRVRPNGLDDTPEYKLHLDLLKASAQGLSIADITDTISTFWGSSYINNFIDRGRVKKVYMQAAPEYRMQPEDFNKIYVRNRNGDMIPFSTFASGEWGYGSPRLERYNGVSSIQILGESAPGRSSGHAMEVMEELAGQLPSGFGYSWTGLSYQERISGSQAPALYTISLIVVFLCLAALYESWSIPFSVMLVVPLGVIGALGGALLRGMNNDVYFQVGLLTIIGLSAKNAILIVEFAKDMEEQGMDLIHATLEAARLRLRPILMTSFAFILGVLPLATSTGPGSASQNAIGTGVACGMLSATVLGVFYIPLAFVIVSRIFKVKVKAHAETEPALVTAHGGGEREDS